MCRIATTKMVDFTVEIRPFLFVGVLSQTGVFCQDIAEIVVPCSWCATATKRQVVQIQQSAILSVLTEVILAPWNAATFLPDTFPSLGSDTEERVECSRSIIVSRRNQRTVRASVDRRG